MKLRVLGLMVCCMLAAAGQANAQVVWDSPTLIPPRAPAGTGIYLVDTHRGGLGVLGMTVSPDFPLDLSWFAGVGAGYSDWLVVSVPLGITLGRTFGAPDVNFTPYLAPKVIPDIHLGRGPNDDNELTLSLDVDLGFDVQFAPGWMIRIGAGLGSRSALAVGILF
jgi:hypothetical protein